MSPFERNLGIRKAVLDVLRQGGYYQRIMDGEAGLDRVKEFLVRMEQPTHGVRQPMQHPTFLPIFPGLDNRPMRDPEGDPVAEYLRQATPTIREEGLRLRSRTVSYTDGIISGGTWRIYPLWYMGTSLSFLTMHCPELKRIAAEIPGCGMAHPFSEALLSWQDPHTHLGAHCSIDGLRLRYSVGIIIEADCTLRVADMKKQWQTGESIIFEDCFEHEAWNGDTSRLVFIIDVWHPDLTLLEREALQSAFRKREVREILYESRMSEPMRPFLKRRFIEEDRDPVVQRYWNQDAVISPPKIEDWGTWDTVPRFS